MDKESKNLIDEWLSDRPNKTKRVWRWIKAIYFDRRNRNIRLISIIHWLLKAAVASSAPVLAYIYGTIEIILAIFISSVLFTVNTIISILDRITKDDTEEKSDSTSEIILRFGDLLSTLNHESTPRKNKDNAIASALGIIEAHARKITKSKKGEIGVSLVLYEKDGTQMTVRHRNPGNTRPIGRVFDSGKVLGHFACQMGDVPRVVFDLKEFGSHLFQSPTQSVVNYRTILIVPISKRTRGNGIIGFVSVDCKRPFAFYGHRAKELLVVCEPVFNHVRNVI